MDTQENLATITPPTTETAVVAVEQPVSKVEKDPLMALLESAVAEQEEYVKTKLQSLPPAKQLRPGKVDEAKRIILEQVPQAPSGIRESELRKQNGKKDILKDEMDQALYEMAKMRILGTIGAFFYRQRIR